MLANGYRVKCFGRTNLTIDINNTKRVSTFYVFDQLRHDVIVGTDIIQAFGLEQRRGLGVFHGDTLISIEPKSGKQLWNVQPSRDNSVGGLVRKYGSLFEGIGRTQRIQHEIKLQTKKVVRHKRQLIPVHWQKALGEHIRELVQMGIIEESTSEFRSRIVPIKKDGSIRMAVDFRDVNALSQTDAFPMPRIHDIILKLAKSKIFSKLDLKKGYYQIPMSPESKQYTAFAFKNKLYQFRYMPFGLVSAPQTFQRLMDQILGNLDFVEYYLDDVIVHSQTEEEHRNHLQKVFSILTEENLKLNKEKCQFGREEVDYLGLTIKGGNRTITPANKEKILQFPVPQNQKEAKTFVCLASFYRDLIPNFASMAQPIYDCTNKSKFSWQAEEERAFAQIKEAIRRETGLPVPDVTKQFTVTTDASDVAMGGTLTQLIDGEKRPVDFFSRNFNKTQRRYSTYEKEATAIIEALKHWRYFLLGKPFRIETDHKPLKWLLSKRDCAGKLGRMVLKLQEYQIENIDHVKGGHNILADTLSRIQLNMIQGQYQPGTEDDVILRHRQNFIQNGRQWFLVDKNGTRDVYRLYINKTEDRKRILQAVHENGHLGVFKNQEEIRKRFWWPEWKKEVKTTVERCSICQTFKDNIEKTRLPLQPTEVEPHTWRRVGLDICGPFQRTTNGNRYILVMQDYASKFLSATALPVANMESIIRWVRDIFLLFGWPEEIVCDRGAQFESRQFREFTTEHKVMFGHEMTTPLDLEFGIRFQTEDREQLAEERLRVNERMRDRQKYAYDKKLRAEDVRVNDLVLWHQVEQTPGSSKKFKQCWKGPFRVVNSEDVNVEIQDKDGRRRWIHRNHVKKISRERTTDQSRDSADEGSAGEEHRSWGGGVTPGAEWLT
ncbi:UNVERIFIED_CONTAM: hypothetical protein PYX00_008824 [Menopon gallinae]|uniref:RNA-directed DNA polymerase n=1 Tax=Menopon gallinae TaxID=328185 RepID=A0AAW2HQ25_9NEOP